MNFGKKKYLTFVFFLSSILTEKFVHCMIEYSDFTIEELEFLMLTLDEFEKMYRDCQNPYEYDAGELELFWKKEIDPFNNTIAEFMEDLKIEIICVWRRGKGKFKIGDLSRYATTWMVQLMAADYAAKFYRGYEEKKEYDLITATNCAFIAAYLGAFALDPSTRKLFYYKFLESIKWDESLEKEFRSQGMDYGHLIDVLSKINELYIPKKKKFSDDVYVVHEYYQRLEPTFGRMLFGKKKIFQRNQDLIGDAYLWGKSEEFSDFITEKLSSRPTFPANGDEENEPITSDVSDLVAFLRQIELKKAEYVLAYHGKFHEILAIRRTKFGLEVGESLEVGKVEHENGNEEFRFAKRSGGGYFLPGDEKVKFRPVAQKYYNNN